MNEIRKDNHYIAESFLKAWCNEQGKVHAYRLVVSHPNVPLWTRMSPRGAAFQTHLYTRTTAKGESDEVEHWLDSEFESPALPVIQKAKSGVRLTSDEWSHLIRFLAAQDVRTPARFLEMRQRWDEEMPDVLNDTVSRVVGGAKDENCEGSAFQPYTDESDAPLPLKLTMQESGAGECTLRVETVVGRAFWLFAMRHLLTVTLDELLKHRWTILQAPPKIEWLTSDDPVVRLSFRSPSKYNLRSGWGSPGAEIFMPLGPRHLMYTRVGKRPPQRGTMLSADLAAKFQRMIVENAHRYVFATNSDPIVGQIRPRVVDAELFEAEADQWKRWHNEQGKAEIKYFAE